MERDIRLINLPDIILFMHKRGQAEVMQLSQLFDILIGIAVASFLIIAALTWNSMTGYNKAYLEDDLKFVSNAALSSPNHVKITYPASTNYVIEMTDKVKVVHNPSLTATWEKTNLVFEADSGSDQLSIGRGS